VRDFSVFRPSSISVAVKVSAKVFYIQVLPISAGSDYTLDASGTTSLIQQYIPRSPQDMIGQSSLTNLSIDGMRFGPFPQVR
jgi:hypothetical protein